jgi:hypothetical protein
VIAGDKPGGPAKPVPSPPLRRTAVKGANRHEFCPSYQRPTAYPGPMLRCRKARNHRPLAQVNNAFCFAFNLPAGRVSEGHRTGASAGAFSTGSAMFRRKLLSVSSRLGLFWQARCFRPPRLLGAHGSEFRLHLLSFFLGQHRGAAPWRHVVNSRVFRGGLRARRRPFRQATELFRHFGQCCGTRNQNDGTRADQPQPNDITPVPINFPGGFTQSEHDMSSGWSKIEARQVDVRVAAAYYPAIYPTYPTHGR